jgi:hypothetical protein
LVALVPRRHRACSGVIDKFDGRQPARLPIIAATLTSL